MTLFAKKKTYFIPMLPNILQYTCLYPWYSIFALLDQQIQLKILQKAARREFTPIAYVQSSFLPLGSKILHGHCPCVRDKFNVCVIYYNKISCGT